MTPRPAHLRAGFTLLELAVTTAVIGVLAASAIPAFSTLAETRERAAAAEVRRLLLTARSTAAMQGLPTGLAFSEGSCVQPVQITTVGGAPSALAGPGGAAEPVRSIRGLFGGVQFTAVHLGSGASGNVTFWFGFDGAPQTRSAAGVLQPAWTGDGTVTFPRGTTVTVRRISGLIE